MNTYLFYQNAIPTPYRVIDTSLSLTELLLEHIQLNLLKANTIIKQHNSTNEVRITL